MRKPIKFSTSEEVELEQLLDGEPINQTLTNLSGGETTKELLDKLKAHLSLSANKQTNIS